MTRCLGCWNASPKEARPGFCSNDCVIRYRRRQLALIAANYGLDPVTLADLLKDVAKLPPEPTTETP